MKYKKELIIIISSVILLLLEYFYNFIDNSLQTFILLFVIPTFIIKKIFNEKIKDYGLKFGNQKYFLLSVFVGVLCSIIVTYLATRYFIDVKSYYSVTFGLAFVISTIIYMIAWEFIFRGYLFFGLIKKFGFWGANIIQTILFFLVHIGKPGIELYSTLLTGLIFGYITYKSKSVIPMIVIHSAIMIFVVYFASM